MPNADQLLHFHEILDGTIVNDFYVPLNQDDWNDFDKTDPQLKPYFEPGSFWDLDGQKWQSLPIGDDALKPLF